MATTPPDRSEHETQVPLTAGDLVRRLEWRYELLAVLVILAESVLVWLAAGLLLPHVETGEPYPFWIIAFSLLLAHYVIHLLDVARIFSPDFEIASSAAVILSLLVAIKFGSFPEVAIYDLDWFIDAVNALAFFDADQSRSVWGSLLLIVYCWLRGRFRDEPSLDSAYTMLRWGTFALVLLVMIIRIGAADDSQIRDHLALGAVAFFGFSLAAIGIARMRLEGIGARTSAPLSAVWLATFALPILLIGIIAVAAAGVFSGEFLEMVLWLLSPVFFVLGIVFQIIILIIAVLAFLILTPVFWLIGDRRFALDQPQATATIAPGDDPTQSPVQEPFVIPEALQYLIGAIILFIIISLLTRFIFRRRSQRRGAHGEDRESVLDWSDIANSMGNRLRSLFSRTPETDPYAGLRGDDRWRHTIEIRERYRRLQQRGADLGRARREGETAVEYRPALRGTFSPAGQGRSAVDAMTAIYRRTRYSGVPAPEEDAERMDEGWRVVERDEGPETPE